MFGFWDRSSVKVHDFRAIDIKRKTDELNILDVKSKSQRDQIDKDLQDVSLLTKELNSKLSELNDDFSGIESKMKESDISLGEMRRNLEESINRKDQISKLENNITEAFNKISSDINENSTKFNDIANQNNSLKAELEKVIKSSVERNEAIKTTHEYIESQKGEIEKMVGLATDGAIGYKFDERQKEIFKSIGFWKKAVPGSYIFAAIWVACVFTLFNAQFENEWLNLSINLIKTAPAWFLVGFCTNQYKKERDYEEEYAFKSAVAMTITSYTSLLSNDDITQMKTKDQVLSKVLDDLYSSPLKKEHSSRKILPNTKKVNSDITSKTKDLESILKPIIELTKEIKK